MGELTQLSLIKPDIPENIIPLLSENEIPRPMQALERWVLHQGYSQRSAITLSATISGFYFSNFLHQTTYLGGIDMGITAAHEQDRDVISLYPLLPPTFNPLNYEHICAVQTIFDAFYKTVAVLYNSNPQITCQPLNLAMDQMGELTRGGEEYIGTLNRDSFLEIAPVF